MKIYLIIFCLSLIFATLFPPSQWSAQPYNYSGPREQYSYKFPQFKTYNFLLGKSDSLVYNKVLNGNFPYHRTIIYSELLMEYFIIFLIFFVGFFIFGHKLKSSSSYKLFQ